MLTNKQAQEIITEQMKAIQKDPDLSVWEKTKLLVYLNNSQVRNSHVDLRAANTLSRMEAYDQKDLPEASRTLKMPMLK